ncbi:MAG: FlgO family outer membrane protein [Proteobacteria bacterium]|nr:FlgO family outer membrane protein [Pseudomonadota bacterium]
MNAIFKSMMTAAVISGLGLSVSGCANYTTSFETAANNPFIPTNRAAGVALLAQAKGALSPDAPVIMATIVDINVLERSSPLGRVISEQISAAFSHAGYRMIEMKFREKIYIKRNEGELLLTREIIDVAKQHEAQAVIVGTYGIAADTIFVNLKIVQPGTNVVLAAHDYALPKDKNVKAMLPPEREY